VILMIRYKSFRDENRQNRSGKDSFAFIIEDFYNRVAPANEERIVSMVKAAGCIHVLSNERWYDCYQPNQG